MPSGGGEWIFENFSSMGRHSIEFPEFVKPKFVYKNIRANFY